MESFGRHHQARWLRTDRDLALQTRGLIQVGIRPVAGRSLSGRQAGRIQKGLGRIRRLLRHQVQTVQVRLLIRPRTAQDPNRGTSFDLVLVDVGIPDASSAVALQRVRLADHWVEEDRQVEGPGRQTEADQIPD